MKKAFLTIITFSTIYFSSAQDFGIRAGANLSKQKDNFADNYDYKIGYQAGLTSKIGLSENLSFNPSLVWSTKGYVNKYDLYTNENEPSLELKGKATNVVNFNFIEIPLNFGYTLKFGKINPLIQVGPYASFLMSGKYKMYVENKEFHNSKVEVKDLNRFDYGLNVTLGAEIGKFQVLANYVYGLGNQIKNPQKDYYIRNRSFQLTLSYFFKQAE